MLFNKNNNGVEEIRDITGIYYGNNEFNRIKSDIIIETRNIINIVGKEVYDKAEQIYNACEYTDKEWELVEAMQLPIATLAVFRYNQANIISHEDDGRRVKIDNDHEKLPWEWMYDRDDAAALRKAYIAIDNLINFLEENEIAEWINSEKRKAVRSVFISSAKEFNAVYPIDQSQRFYYELLPFIAENQDLMLAPAMGEVFYADFLEKYQKNGISTTHEQRILKLVQRFLALQTIFTACLRFAVSVFPESVSQKFLASSGGRHASGTPADESIRKYATLIEEQAKNALNDVKMAVKNLKAADINYPLIPNNKKSNGWWRA